MADQDLSRPYIGYRSAGRRPESQNDRVASANAPLSAVRGYVAGTLGLPGDIEGLGRMLIPGVSNESYIPGSEYFRKVLPMRELENTPTGRAFSEMGNLTAGAGLTQAAKAGKAGARVVGEELNRAILDNSGALAKLVPQAAQPMYVVKPKGGNWLSSSVESAVDPLLTKGMIKNTYYPYGPEYNAAAAQRIEDLTQQANKPGYNGGALQVAEHLRRDLENPRGTEAGLNRWIEQKLGKYIKNDMGTAGDPVRALAEQGVLHVNPNQLNYRLEAYGKWPQEGQEFLAKSDAAKMWEGASDNTLAISPASDWLKFSGDAPYTKGLEENPWLRKVPPETPVNQISDSSHFADDLGFNHLIDELRNAVDSNTTLPANLRLKYEDLDKVTLPQAVERVSKINDWRSAQAAEAEKASMMGNLTAEPRLQDPTAQLSFVEKPGMTWVDIPATTDDKANALCTTIGKQAGWCTQGASTAKHYGSGNNRLTTLLDADGRPHVQAQLTQQSEEARKADFLGQLNEEKYTRVLNEDPQQAKAMYEEWASQNPPAINIGELKPVGNTFSSARAREYENRDPQYQAKITDSVLKFLNSGEWGKVNDLDHYNIIDIQNPKSVQSVLSDVLPYHISQERAGIFNDAIDKNPYANRFMSKDQLKDFIGPVDLPDTNAEGFAKGGSVRMATGGSVSAYDPFQVEEVMNSIDAPRGYDEGGSVKVPDMEFGEDPELMRLYKYAMRQMVPNKEETASSFGAGVSSKLGSGNLSAGFDMNRMTQGQQDQMMKALAANYNVDLGGGVGLNAMVQKPLEAKDVFLGMLNGSIPLGEGRAMLGIQGVKTPYGSEVLGYNAGYAGKVGPGNLNVNVNKPKYGSKSAQVQYQVPFAQGGSVSTYDPDQIDAIANQFM